MNTLETATTLCTGLTMALLAVTILLHAAWTSKLYRHVGTLQHFIRQIVKYVPCPKFITLLLHCFSTVFCTRHRCPNIKGIVYTCNNAPVSIAGSSKQDGVGGGILAAIISRITGAQQAGSEDSAAVEARPSSEPQEKEKNRVLEPQASLIPFEARWALLELRQLLCPQHSMCAVRTHCQW